MKHIVSLIALVCVALVVAVIADAADMPPFVASCFGSSAGMIAASIATYSQRDRPWLRKHGRAQVFLEDAENG